MTAQKPLRSLAAIVELPSRVHAVGERVARLGSAGFVAALDVLARDAARGATSADSDAMLACALWLASAGRRALIEDLLEAAKRGEHLVVSALLDDGPAHKQLSRHGRLPDGGGPNRVERYRKFWSPPESALAIHLDELHFRSHPSDDHELPAERQILLWSPALPAWEREYDSAEALGVPEMPEAREGREERGAWIRVPLRLPELAKQLERLAMRPDPAVLRALLRDRAVRLRDVVMIAARRPTTAPIVAELVAHVGWMARPSVRTAMLENPFTPTRTALLLLPTCRARLRAVARANVHPRLRALAMLLVA